MAYTNLEPALRQPMVIGILRDLKANPGRKLTSVFFVGTSKSHQFQLSVRSVYSVLAVLGLLAVLFICSLTANSLLMGTLTETRQQVRELKGTLFSYQVRYEKLYEMAYHDSFAPKPEPVGKDIASSQPLPAKADPKAKKTL